MFESGEAAGSYSRLPLRPTHALCYASLIVSNPNDPLLRIAAFALLPVRRSVYEWMERGE